MGITYDEDDRFWGLDFAEHHKQRLIETIKEDKLFCIVDETKGGIVAYAIMGNEGLIDLLNNGDDGKYKIVRRLTR